VRQSGFRATMSVVKPVARVAGAALLLVAGSISIGLSAGPRVVIDSPSPDYPLLGEIPVVFRVEGVPAGDVARAAIIVDSREAAVVQSPPWQAVVDFGEDLVAHRVEVVVTLRDGRRVKAGLTSRRPAGTVVEVRLVNLSVTVTDRGGKPARGLVQDDFEVRDAGQPVTLAHWESAPAGLAVAVVLDTSLSMQGEKIEDARSAASALIRELDDRDRVMLLSFSDEVLVRAPLDPDRGAAAREVDKLAAAGGTALYDAVYNGAEELRRAPPDFRKVIVLLSDGRDESASGLEPGSFHTQEEAIRQAHLADATVFALGLGALEDEKDFTGRMTTEEVLQRFARTTGGTFRKVRSARLSAAFRDVLEEVRLQYGMSYRPPTPRPGETWRSVEVKVRKPGLSVRTREGYFVN